MAKFTVLPKEKYDEIYNRASDDCVSRQAINDMIENHKVDFSTEKDYLTAVACVKAVPPNEQKPIKGKWMMDNGQQILMRNSIKKGETWRICSACGAGHMIGHQYEYEKIYHNMFSNFCPNCGAEMEVDDGPDQ